ncbi:hypothetical protein, partial [Cognatilysobacter lacus]|uniref:hypothetical protein n=1 Tax=Cognatilysobacter lacus TaxID=1643323 RepID=UPI00195FDD44
MTDQPPPPTDKKPRRRNAPRKRAPKQPVEPAQAVKQAPERGAPLTAVKAVTARDTDAVAEAAQAAGTVPGPAAKSRRRGPARERRATSIAAAP